MKKQVLVLLLKYGLGIGLLVWVVWSKWHLPSEDGKEDLGLAGALERPINVGPLVLAGCICLVSVLLTFVRWYILVCAQGLPFTMVNAFRLGLVGYFMSTFLPGAIGGDIVKAAYIAREQTRRTVAVATVLLDRAIGLTALFWLVAFLGGVFWGTGFLNEFAAGSAARTTLETIILGAIGLTGASILFWLLLGVLPTRRAEIFAGRLSRIPKLGHALAEFWRAVWMYRCRGGSVALALLLALVGHVGFVLTFYFASRTLSAPDVVPSLGAQFLVVPVGMAIEAGLPAPGGVGVGEAAYGGLFESLRSGQAPGVLFAAGVLGSLVKRVCTWVIGLAGYLVYLRMRPSLRPAMETPAPTAAASALALAAEQDPA